MMQAICKQQSIAWFAAFMVLLLQSRPSDAASDRRGLEGQCSARPRWSSLATRLGCPGSELPRESPFFYGEVYQAKPRVGIIREYTLDLKPTGRDIQLARNGKPLLVHPTGLTWDGVSAASSATR